MSIDFIEVENPKEGFTSEPKKMIIVRVCAGSCVGAGVGECGRAVVRACAAFEYGSDQARAGQVGSD